MFPDSPTIISSMIERQGFGVAPMQAESTQEYGTSTSSPRSRLAAYRQLALSLQLPEDQKGFNPAALPTNFASFAHPKVETIPLFRNPAPVVQRQSIDECGTTPAFAVNGRVLSAYASLLGEEAMSKPRSPSPIVPKVPSFLGSSNAAAAKRPPKSLPRMTFPGQGSPVELDFDWLASVPLLAAASPPTPATLLSDDATPQRTCVLEVKKQQRAEIELRSGHLYFHQEGDDPPYRIENLAFSMVTEDAAGVVQVEGPYCVTFKLQFLDVAVAGPWISALGRANQAPGTSSPTNVVEKSGTLVKVKDTVFGNRSVVARLVDNHLQLFSSATSRAPYRVEHLLGASVRITDTCFFLDGPYCLPGIYKLGTTEQAAEWVGALQCAITSLESKPAPARARARVPDDAAFQTQLAQHLRALQELLLGVPAPWRAEAVDRLTRFHHQLTSELGAPGSKLEAPNSGHPLRTPSRDSLL